MKVNLNTNTIQSTLEIGNKLGINISEQEVVSIIDEFNSKDNSLIVPILTSKRDNTGIFRDSLFSENDLVGSILAAKRFGVKQATAYLALKKNTEDTVDSVGHIIHNSRRLQKGIDPIRKIQITEPTITASPNIKRDNDIPQFSFGQAFSAAASRESTIRAGYDLFKKNSFTFKPDENFKPARYAIEKGFGNFIDDLEDAVSAEHADSIIADIEKRQQTLQSLDTAPTAAFLGALAGATLDPINFLALGGGTTMATRALKGALTVSSATSAQEVILQQNDPTRTVEESLYAIGFSTALGSGIGALSKSVTIPTEVIKEAEILAKKEGIKSFKTDKFQSSEKAAEEQKKLADIEIVDDIPLQDHVTADTGKLFSGLLKLTGSITAHNKIMTSEVWGVQKLGRQLISTNIASKANLKGRTLGASVQDIFEAGKSRGLAFVDELSNTIKLTAENTGKTGEEIVDILYASRDAGQPLLKGSPEFRQAYDAINEIYDNIAKKELKDLDLLADIDIHQIKHGEKYHPVDIAESSLISDIDGISPYKRDVMQVLGGYQKRLSDDVEVNQMLDEILNVKTLEDFYKLEINKMNTIRISDEIKVGKKSFKFRNQLISEIRKADNTKKPKDFKNIEIKKLVDDNPIQAYKILRDIVGNWATIFKKSDIRKLADEDELHRLRKENDVSAITGGKVGPLKSRSLSIPLKSIRKHLSKDIERSLLRYLHKIEYTKALKKAFNVDSKAAAKIHITNQLGKDAIEQINKKKLVGIEKAKLLKEVKKGESDLHGLLDLIDNTSSMPRDPHSISVRAARVLRSHAVITALGKLPLTMAIEAANVAAFLIFSPYKAMLKKYGTIFGKMDKKSAMYLNVASEDQSARLMSRGLGLGEEDMILHKPGLIEKAYTKTTGSFFKYTGALWVDKTMRKATFQRLLDENVLRMQRMLNGTATKDELAELAVVGIEKKQAKAILDNIKKHGEPEVDGLTAYNMDKWDTDAYLATTGMQKKVLEYIPRPNDTDVPDVLNTQWGKTMFMFMRFIFGAQGQKMLPRLQQLDAKSSHIVGLMTAELIMASFVVYTRHILDGKDPSELTDNPDKFLMRTIQYSGVTGIASDLAALGINLLAGDNPGDSIRDVAPGLSLLSNAQALRRVVFEDSGSERDYMKAKALIPFMNTIYLSTLSSKVAKEMAKEKSASIYDVTELTNHE